MSDFDWTRFVTRVPVKASFEKLYWCWATREGMEYWFLRMSEYNRPNGEFRKSNEFAEPGDNYMWRWHGWSDEVTETGKILDCNGKDLIKFSFGNAGNCTIRFIEENGNTMVELVQDNIPDDEYGRHYWHLGCKTGWTFYLTNLKSLLEGGLDLRNKNEDLKNVINS